MESATIEEAYERLHDFAVARNRLERQRAFNRMSERQRRNLLSVNWSVQWGWRFAQC